MSTEFFYWLSSPGSEKGEAGVWRWPTAESRLLRTMLQSLLHHCLLHTDAGWMKLQHIAFQLRSVKVYLLVDISLSSMLQIGSQYQLGRGVINLRA